MRLRYEIRILPYKNAGRLRQRKINVQRRVQTHGEFFGEP